MNLLYKFIDRFILPVFLNIIFKNRYRLEGEDKDKVMEAGLLGAVFDAISFEKLMYWIKVEPVCSERCSAPHYQGEPFYLNPLGMFVKHTLPPTVCTHGVSQLSAAVFQYYDYLVRDQDPGQMIFSNITCTDPGMENDGMGKVCWQLTYERMPFLEFLRFLLQFLPALLFKDRKMMGDCRAVEEAPTSGGPEPDAFMKSLPLEEEELEAFLASPNRVKRLRALERFRDHRIVIEVVKSRGCIAGHKEGDKFVLDCMGRVLPGENGGPGPCIMALVKAWPRQVITILERMAEDPEHVNDYTWVITQMPMSCYGGGLALGACGEIHMAVSLRAPGEE